MVARYGPDGCDESDGEISERAAKKRRTEQDEQDVEQQGEAENAPRQDGAHEGEDVAAEALRRMLRKVGDQLSPAIQAARQNRSFSRIAVPIGHFGRGADTACGVVRLRARTRSRLG